MAVIPGQIYRDEEILRKVVEKHWFCFQLTDRNKTTIAYRYDQRSRIYIWCYETYGTPYGIIDPESFSMFGKWFYAEAIMSNLDDFLFFKNEADATLFILKFSNEVVKSNL